MPRREAVGAYYFQVEIEGTVGFFRSCSGLKSEAEVQEVAEGGFNTTTRKLIGRTKFPNIVLKQGMCSPNSGLWQLRQLFLNDSATPTKFNKEGKNTGKGRQTPNRFSGTITQMGPNGAEAKWVFSSGWI